jgi:hypothetical protein
MYFLVSGPRVEGEDTKRLERISEARGIKPADVAAELLRDADPWRLYRGSTAARFTKLAMGRAMGRSPW